VTPTFWLLQSTWHWGIGIRRVLARVWRNYDIGVQVITKRRAGIRVREVNHSEAAYLIDRRGFERALFLYPFKAGDVESMLELLAGKG
jgi:cytochrome oxidase Cu insertion factor (SCO1/SenC/PrrC family)